MALQLFLRTSRRQTLNTPVFLKLKGTLTAGQKSEIFVERGEAIRILSGANIPNGTNAVISEEFAVNHETYIIVTRNAEPGRNILKKGNDISRGERIISIGEKLIR